MNESGWLDYNEIEDFAKKHKPKLIISGTTAYPRAIDFKKFEKIAKKVGAYHLSDIAHIFNEKIEKHWGVKEWEYFLRDLTNNVLTTNGRIFFMLNRLHGEDQEGYVPAELAKYFRSKGGQLQNQFLYFPTTDCFKSNG